MESNWAKISPSKSVNSSVAAVRGLGVNFQVLEEEVNRLEEMDERLVARSCIPHSLGVRMSHRWATRNFGID